MNTNNPPTHRDFRKENTLTSPQDRNLEQKFRLDQNAPEMTEEQVREALKALNDSTLIPKYPEFEKRYLDPVIADQKFFLISFTPAKGATPNEAGIYGFAKVRGSYASDHEANERAEYLIRTTDSFHKIFHGFVGRPFPLTVNSDFSADINTVDLKKHIVESTREDVKKKRMDEQKEIEEMKEREKQLLDDVKKAPEDNPEDHYTTLKVKDAQLRWTYLETEKKMKQMLGSLARARKDIEEMDAKDPSYKQKYMEKYLNARKEANLPVDKQEFDTSFMKYLVQDVAIPAVDAEYERLFGTSSEL